MSGRHLTTAVTLLVLVGILVAGLLIGIEAFFAPVDDDEDAAAEPAASCETTSVEKGQRVRSRQVQVSVFNGGSRAGLADVTMDALVNRGFRKGDIGNAPAESNVTTVAVLSTERNDTSARLVARQFGAKVKVRFVDRDLGPGVDVIVGNGFRKLVKAPRVIVVGKSSAVCVPVQRGAAS